MQTRAKERSALPTHQHLAPVRGGAAEAIGVAHWEDGDARWRRSDIGGSIADAFASGNLFDLGNLCLER